MSYSNPYFRSARNYDADAASAASGLVCPEPTLTQQSQKDEADINVIVKRFGVTGKVPLDIREPILVDFDTPLDYRMMVDMIRDADEQFMKLPAAVRARFANDPAAFVDFASDPANVDELRKMGLAKEKANVAAEGGKSGAGAGEQAGASA